MSKTGFILFIIFAASLYAQNVELNYSKMNYGSPYQFLNARSLAMGGSGISDGSTSSDFMLNPALGVMNPYDLSVSAMGHFNKYQEDLSFPYFDSFNGFLDYGSYVFNENWYSDFSGSVNYILPQNLLEGIPVVSIGIAANPFLDFNYDYIEEVRTTGFNDNILAYNKILSEGMLQEISFNLAAEPIKNFALGINIGMISGKIEQSKKINNVDSSLVSINRRELSNRILKSTPFKMNFGLFYQANEFLSIGSNISLPYSLEFETDYTLRNADTAFTTMQYQLIDYPMSLNFGVSYQFTNILLARINFDFEYTFWSDITDDLNPDLRFDDTYNIKVGVEHVFMDKVPFRVGFNYAPLRENKSITRTILTAGTGMVFDNFSFELSGGISSLTYNQFDMYDNALYGETSRGEEALDRVETNFFYGIVEVNYFLDF